MSEPDLRERLATDLAALGGSPDDVAKTLLEGDFLGVPNDRSFCPVAYYLTGRGFHRADVIGHKVRVQESSDPLSAWVTEDAPAAVHSFVNRFDSGEYPALEMVVSVAATEEA